MEGKRFHLKFSKINNLTGTININPNNLTPLIKVDNHSWRHLL